MEPWSLEGFRSSRSPAHRQGVSAVQNPQEFPGFIFTSNVGFVTTGLSRSDTLAFLNFDRAFCSVLGGSLRLRGIAACGEK